MSLAEKLEAMRARSKAVFTPEMIATVERHIETLRHGGAMQQVAKTGSKMPDFALKNQRGETVTRDQLLARGPLVISFTRGSWCPYCVEETRSWNEAYPDIQAAGGELIVVSPQGPQRDAKARRAATAEI